MSDTRASHPLPWSSFSTARLRAFQAFLDGSVRTRSDIATVIGQSLPSAANHIDALESLGLISEVSTRDGEAHRADAGSTEGSDPSQPASGRPLHSRPASPTRAEAERDAAAGGRPPRSTGAGRPAAAWRLNPRAGAAIGMELRPGGPRRAAARVATRIVLLDGSIACERERAVGWKELRATRSLIREEARAIQQTPDAAGLSVTSLGIALPGVVDCYRSLLIYAPNLFLSNVGFADLESSLGMPVFVENEANAAALAEYVLRSSSSGRRWSLGATERPGAVAGTGGAESAQGDARSGAVAARPGESMVRISITEGVGAGILVDGGLMRGDTWRAGEFGHMAIREGSRPCNCGRTGCWEQYASEWALLADARGAGVGARTIGGVVRQVAVGRPEAQAVWRSYVHALATGIENIAACIDPRTIVLGGEIASAGDLLVTPLRREVESISFLTSGIQVDVSLMGRWPASVGAALLSFGNIFHNSP
ncbi:MAG: ROK family transcriptional regulator [Spirochaetales bacterium]